MMVNPDLSNHFNANYLHIRHLYILRTLFIVVQMTAIFIAVFYMHLDLPMVPLILELIALTTFNIYVRQRLRRYDDASDTEIFRHLFIDVCALSIVLYFTGGASNPFITLYIFPLIISVTVMPARFSWIFAAITFVAYTFLMFQYQPLEMQHAEHKMGSDFNTHIMGMWMAFALSAGLVAHFVAKMGNTIRLQQNLLVKAKENALRDRQIIELGTLAASTAHELGTPLGTMNLLVTELKKEIKDVPGQVSKDLDLLKNQIDRCKEALSNLSASAGAINISEGTITNVADYLSNVLHTWQSVRPDIEVKTSWHDIQSPANILDDRTLTQAIINILDNAADVSPKDIEWDAVWSDKQLVMEIRDRGHGLSEDLKHKLGKTPVTEKEQGLGLGLFLSHTIIERFGGSVNLLNREGGGMTTRIIVPLVK